MKSDVTSSDDMKRFESNSTTSLAKENESFTVYSLVVIGWMKGTRNFVCWCCNHGDDWSELWQIVYKGFMDFG